MEIDPQTKRRISETVTEILRAADIDLTTEFDVRREAERRLGVHLASSDHRRLVRDVLESFLLSIDDSEDAHAPPSEATASVSPSVVQRTTAAVPVREQHASTKPDNFVCADRDDILVCKLSKKRTVSVQGGRGRKTVSICDCYEKNGKQTPTSRGITLSAEQWSAFTKSVPAVEEAIVRMESKIQSKLVENKNGNEPNSVTYLRPVGLFPIRTTRLDENNYPIWAQQMECFLNQLNIAYVLADTCPSITSNPMASMEEIARSKAAVQKWIDDDYICHHHILNSLSDKLYNKFLKKTTKARDLWEELKLLCVLEYGTKRSKIKRYIEFQMVDEKPILDQVYELNRIADLVAAAGIFINEYFHVSVVISKLPPSWRGCQTRLMREEDLPFWMMMECLQVEEESQNRARVDKASRNNSVSAGEHKIRDTKMVANVLESQQEKQKVCYICCKKGHTSKGCNERRIDNETTRKKRNENGAAMGVTAEGITVEICCVCGKKGHTFRNCNERKFDNDTGKARRDEDGAVIGVTTEVQKVKVCFVCGKKGHCYRNCNERKRDANGVMAVSTEGNSVEVSARKFVWNRLPKS